MKKNPKYGAVTVVRDRGDLAMLREIGEMFEALWDSGEPDRLGFEWVIVVQPDDIDILEVTKEIVGLPVLPSTTIFSPRPAAATYDEALAVGVEKLTAEKIFNLEFI